MRNSTAGESPKSDANWASMADTTVFSLFDEALKSTFPVWM